MMQTAVTKEQSVVFLEHFSVLEDPRQQGKVEYPLAEILLLVLCAVLAGADSWVEIAKFGEKKLDFLRRFQPFKNGTPSHDQLEQNPISLNRIFAPSFCFVAQFIR